MKPWNFLFWGVISVALISGCAGSKPAVPDEQTNARITAMENDKEKMQSDLQKLAKLAAEKKPVEADNKIAAYDAELQTMKTDLRTLQATVKGLEEKTVAIEKDAPLVNNSNRQILDDIQLLKSQLKQLSDKLKQNGTISVTNAPVNSVETPAAKSAKKRNVTEYKNDYSAALTDFQTGKYPQARKMFIDLVETNPENSMSDNAQYWIGETYYMEGKFQLAIVEFEKVFTFTLKDKWDDAQFKLGLCYRKLGDDEKAADEMQRLVKYYPYSEYYQQAQNILNNVTKK